MKLITATLFEHYTQFEHKKLDLINGDYYDYLKNEDLSNFDYIFTDIHVEGDNFYPDVLIPIRNYLLENYPTIPFDFWQEDMLKHNYLKKLNISYY